MKETVRKKIVFWFWFIVIAPITALAIMLFCVWRFAEIPSFEELEHPNSKLATRIFGDDGTVISTFHIENRTYVPYDELSPFLISAAVSTEDARFYKHSGIDGESLLRVAVKTLMLRDSSQGGGSTITQQLAKTLYPRPEMEKSNPLFHAVNLVWVKFKEWITAIKLERDYTKDEIIDMYLNSVFFGSGAYGIQAASETFFSKAPSELNLQESATLIGMVNKPTRYNPALHPDLSIGRRNFVLSQMQKNGAITKAECDSVSALPIELSYHVQDHNAGIGPYFRDMIRREMSSHAPKRSDYRDKEEWAADTLRWNEDNLYGWLDKNLKPDGSRYDLDRDGLRIYTTINPKMQKYAEEAVAEHLGKDLQKSFERELYKREHAPYTNDINPETVNKLMNQARKWSDRYRSGRKAGLSEEEIMAQFSKPVRMRVFSWDSPKGGIDTVMTPDDSIRYYKAVIRGAFFAMEPNTGYVKAYVGGPDYRYFKYDNVRMGKRQVGSTIKPFLYTLAVQEGMTPCDRIVNVPQSFVAGNTTWTPRSTDKDEWIGKTVTLKWGLTHSSNNISAYLMKQFGPVAMANMMRKMGVTSHIDEVYSLCVGPADLTLYEMVAAYNTFPSRGVYSTPVFVTRIEDRDGNVLSTFSNSHHEAISDRTAYLMVNLMEGVINQGTGVRLHWKYNIPGEIAGKTGTTNENSDGWFIGYTPQLCAGAWVGGEDRMVHFESDRLGQGSNMALPIWGIFMKKCYSDPSVPLNPNSRFEAPAGMNLDLSCTGGDIETDSPDFFTKTEDYFN